MSDQPAEQAARENIVADWLLQWKGRVLTLNKDCYLDLMARIDTALLTRERAARLAADREIEKLKTERDAWERVALNHSCDATQARREERERRKRAAVTECDLCFEHAATCPRAGIGCP